MDDHTGLFLISKPTETL